MARYSTNYECQCGVHYDPRCPARHCPVCWSPDGEPHFTWCVASPYVKPQHAD